MKTNFLNPKYISLISILCIAFFLSNSSFAQTFAGGTGTSGDPYQITNVTQLQEMKNFRTSHFILINNIDALATSGWNSGAGFEPVGILGIQFTGSLNGEGYTITGLTINRPSQNYVGLFGYSSGDITDVGLENVSVSGFNFVGGLVGRNNFGTITNSYSTGSVTGSNVRVGGLVGVNFGTITNSYSTGSVSGNEGVGGLMGSNSGTITNSYSTGNVTGTGVFVGGLMGSNSGTGTITNSYSTGSVSGNNFVGGLVGVNQSTITNSYSTGSVSGHVYVGGLVGRNNFGTITNSYSTGSVYSTGNVFANSIVGGLVGNNDGTINASYSTGIVTGNVRVGGLVGENYGIITNSNSTGSVSGHSFVGGLVGINEGTITTSYSTGSVTGIGSVGGLVSFNVNATITNSYSTGSVTGTGGRVGGLVGANYNATITNSYSIGSVTGSNDRIGGLVGLWENGGQITNSYWNTTTSGQATSAGGTELTDTEFRQQVSFTGFDFNNVWDILTGSTTSYPFLQDNQQVPQPGFFVLLLPTVATSSATSITSISSQLNGIINPNGSITDAYFEWGTDNTLTTFSTTSTQSIGSGSTNVSVSKALSGLSAGTTYYFRAVGENSKGTERGEILNFTTPTLQQGIQMIIALVNQYVSTGILNNGNGNALRAPLYAAINQINNNNNATAINQLNAFLNQVNAFINSGRLTPAQGQALIDPVNTIIAQLNGSGDNIVTEIPEDYDLSQNYPNPFNPVTNINFALPVESRVTLKIYDITGREITTLVNEIKSAGYHVASFDASHLSSGVYFYRIEAQEFSEIKRMMLVK